MDEMNLMKFWKDIFGGGEKEIAEKLDKLNEDPEKYLEEHGVADATPEDFSDAFDLYYEENTFGAQNQSSNTDIDSGGNTVVQTGPIASPTSNEVNTHAHEPAAPAQPPASPPPPPTYDPATPPAEAVAQTVNYYVTETTTYHTENHSSIDDRDEITNVDSSVNTQVQADGPVTLDIDNATASGDGAVAAGGDADGVNTGDNGTAVSTEGKDSGVAIADGEGSVAIADDSSAPINTGTFTGVQNDDGTVEDVTTIGGDNSGFATGDGDIDDVTAIGGDNSGTAIGEVEDSIVNGTGLVDSDPSGGNINFGDGDGDQLDAGGDIQGNALGDHSNGIKGEEVAVGDHATANDVDVSHSNGVGVDDSTGVDVDLILGDQNGEGYDGSGINPGWEEEGDPMAKGHEGMEEDGADMMAI